MYAPNTGLKEESGLKKKILEEYREELGRRIIPRISWGEVVRNGRIAEVKSRKKLKSGKVKEYVSYRVYADIGQDEADKKFVIIPKAVHEILRRIYEGRHEDLIEIVELNEKHNWVLNYVPFVVDRAIFTMNPDLEPEHYRFDIKKYHEEGLEILDEKVYPAMISICERFCESVEGTDAPEVLECDGVRLEFGVYPIRLENGKPGLIVYIKEVS